MWTQEIKIYSWYDDEWCVSHSFIFMPIFLSLLARSLSLVAVLFQPEWNWRKKERRWEAKCRADTDTCIFKLKHVIKRTEIDLTACILQWREVLLAKQIQPQWQVLFYSVYFNVSASFFVENLYLSTHELREWVLREDLFLLLSPLLCQHKMMKK